MAMSFILAAAMPLSGAATEASETPAAAVEAQETSGAAAELSETVAEIAEQLSDPNDDPFDYTQKEAKEAAVAAAKSTYPASLDLRDYEGMSYVTPVKLQNPYGNCWGFAAIAAAETSILGNDELRGEYTADVRREPGKIQMDLSEKQLTYFEGVPIDDPDHPQNGEGNFPYVMKGEDPVATIYNEGGQATTATSLFASGVGPVLESEDPLYEYRGKKGTIQKEWIDGAFRDYCYSPSPQDDWKLDESMRFRQSFALQESFMLPCPANYAGEDEGRTYVFNEAGIAAIKSQLLQKRGVQIGYFDDSFVPGLGETHGRYINDNWAHYSFDVNWSRHAVCIVGYDDNYAAENFRHESDDPEDYSADDTVPPGDGAWLVKNSWGSGLEDFPNKGEGYWGIREVKRDGNGDPVTDEEGNPIMAGSGYFWLSYYDQNIGTPEALAFDKVSDSEDVIDQHDCMPVSEYDSAHVENEVRTANIFTAGVCEQLRAVSCETTYPGTEVTFEIYLLANGYEDPSDGLLMDTVKAGPFEYGGFHKVGLNAPFTVMRGQSYSIVMTQKVPEDGGGSSYGFSIRRGRLATAVINEGESFVFADGTWMDYSDLKVRAALLGEGESYVSEMPYDNFPIKGYASEKPDVILEVDTDAKMVNLREQGEDHPIYFKAWITDNTGGDIDVVPEWEIAEGGEEVISLNDGRDPTRKSLVAKRLGGTYLIVKAEGIGTVIYPIRVNMMNPKIKHIESGSNSITITTHDDLSQGIDGYELSYRIKGENAWTVQNCTPAKNTLVLSGLKTGMYEIMLRYWADTGGKRYFSPKTMRDCAIPPAATAKVRLTNVASGIKVDWDKVEGAKYYKVYRGSKLLFVTSRLYGTDKEVKSDNGKKYTYKVVASLTKDEPDGDSPKSRTGTGYRLIPVGIKSLSSPAAGKMTVTYDKNAKAYGYVVRFGLKSDMSDAKVITVQGADTTSRTFSGLSSGKTYYVQVRTYKLENGVRYYSGYCTTKTVKVK
ncbi:MAG: hypothetical protein J6S47_02100 [Eubacteriaceae bacterium]|nr:hypothetical protein [Eubacteriaceae bacterium]